MNISAEGNHVDIFIRLTAVVLSWWIALLVAHVALAYLATKRIRLLANVNRISNLIVWFIPIIGPMYVLWRYRAPPQPPPL